MKNKNLLKEILVYGLFALILYLFYKSWWAFLAMIPAVIIYHRHNKKNIEKDRCQTLKKQFKDALISMTAALRAGYSAENSISESYKEMTSVYGPESPICIELNKVIHEIQLGTNIETALNNFADRNHIDDLYTFASVFTIAKKGGGDLVEIMKKTSDDISSKIDTMNEIDVLISSKKLEQNIMSFMPLAIILYIDIASPSLIEPLYGNITGAAIMTLCLGIYALSFYLSGRIMNIEV